MRLREKKEGCLCKAEKKMKCLQEKEGQVATQGASRLIMNSDASALTLQRQDAIPDDGLNTLLQYDENGLKALVRMFWAWGKPPVYGNLTALSTEIQEIAEESACDPPYSFADYKVLTQTLMPVVGSGGQGTVKSIILKGDVDQESMVLKVFKNSNNIETLVLREMRLCKQFFVKKSLKKRKTPGDNHTNFDDDYLANLGICRGIGITNSEYCLMYECHTCEVFDLLDDTQFEVQLSDVTVDIIRHASELLEALCYLETFQVMHFDIKPENIMYNETKKKLILIDFGYAHYGPMPTPPGTSLRATLTNALNDELPACGSLANHLAPVTPEQIPPFGTWGYMPHTELSRNVKWCQSRDCWGLGMTLYLLYFLTYTRYIPYNGNMSADPLAEEYTEFHDLVRDNPKTLSYYRLSTPTPYRATTATDAVWLNKFVDHLKTVTQLTQTKPTNFEASLPQTIELMSALCNELIQVPPGSKIKLDNGHRRAILEGVVTHYTAKEARTVMSSKPGWTSLSSCS